MHTCLADFHVPSVLPDRPPAGGRPPDARGRWALARAPMIRVRVTRGVGGGGEGRASAGAAWLAASRFVKYPIPNGRKKFRTWTLEPTWRARVCKWAGGFMKRGERRGQAKGGGQGGGEVWRLPREAPPCRPLAGPPEPPPATSPPPTPGAGRRHCRPCEGRGTSPEGGRAPAAL